MEQTSDMRHFAQYTILSVLGTLGVSCYILADTFFVSKGLGANGLTALILRFPHIILSMEQVLCSVWAVRQDFLFAEVRENLMRLIGFIQTQSILRLFFP